jgi:hypothetical protein
VKRAAWLLLFVASLAQAATFNIVNKDTAGEGLNDPTPFTPVGGNNATTLGQARLNVLVEAGRIWGAQLASPVPITVEASFNPLACTSSTATLGSAGARYFYSRSFPGGTFLVPSALQDSLTGGTNGGNADIFAQFNSDVRTGNTACISGRGFYLGLDHAPGTDFDLLAVVLHEYGHGLGFVSLIDQNGNVTSSGPLSAFDQFVYSETLGRFWPAMTAAERGTSLTDSGRLVFNSPSLNAVLSQLTGGLSNPGGHLRIYAPATYSDGSSGSHWDTPAQWTVGGSTRSLMMEPNLTPNPLGVTDFTGCALKDMGWLGTRCPDSTGVPRSAVPTALPQVVSTVEDTPVSFTIIGTGGVSSNLNYVITAQPAKGTLSTPASLSGSSGITYTYTPNANANGADSFTFTVDDGATTSAAATVTINVTAVNDAPVANAQTVSTAAGAAVNITLSGSDVEGSTLTYAVVGNPASGTLTGTAPNLSYMPNTGFSGADSFTFRVNDGVLNSANATVTINVSAPAAVTGSSGGGGGGGGALDALGLAALLMTLFTLAGRRSVPPRCTASKHARSWGGRSR